MKTLHFSHQELLPATKASGLRISRQRSEGSLTEEMGDVPGEVVGLTVVYDVSWGSIC